MSIEARQTFLKRMETKLLESYTIGEVNALMTLITEEISKFKMEAIRQDESDAETDIFIKTFLEAKRLEGRSEKTISHYQYVLSRFFDETAIPIRDISVFHLRSFLMREKERGISDRTLEGFRCVYSSFFGWLKKEELLDHNPCVNLSPVKCVKKVRLPYTEVEIEKLKEACQCSRDRAIISFLLSTGCRISEVCSLNRDNINLQKQECIVFGKGAKERTVFIDDVTKMLLERYLDERFDTEQALFVGKQHIRLQPNGVRVMLNKVADRAGIEHVHPHKFRRTLATNLINRGMPIQEVASVLGHDKLDTTMTYIYMDKENIRTSYRRYN